MDGAARVVVDESVGSSYRNAVVSDRLNGPGIGDIRRIPGPDGNAVHAGCFDGAGVSGNFYVGAKDRKAVLARGLNKAATIRDRGGSVTDDRKAIITESSNSPDSAIGDTDILLTGNRKAAGAIGFDPPFVAGDGEVTTGSNCQPRRRNHTGAGIVDGQSPVTSGNAGGTGTKRSYRA